MIRVVGDFATAITRRRGAIVFLAISRVIIPSTINLLIQRDAER
jgi:hypothetical protein